IAARLAVGYALEEIPNDITRRTPASFEPAIDYTVVKWPRFAFEKFPDVGDELTTHMQSVGEVMAIGRTFQQAFAKALRSRELDKPPRLTGRSEQSLLDDLATPGPARFETLLELLGRGASLDAPHPRTPIDPWFLRESGRDAVMINCNPETVSTDYDTSDRLYFEPLTLEDVLAVMELERPEGAIVQFGGQTPLKLARGLVEAGVPVLGTSVDAIDQAEDRGRFGSLLERLGYHAPPYATARSVEEALRTSERVGFPLLVRPSYVLGGRAMEIVYSREALHDYLRRETVEGGEIFLDRFLENATEV